MHTLRLWILCLLMPLLAPAAWAGVVQAMPGQPTVNTAPPVHSVNMAMGMPCHGHADHTDASGDTPTQPPHHRLGCGDCSACHVLALLPADWRLSGPALVQADPGWHATPYRGRPRGCELYRPPRA